MTKVNELIQDKLSDFNKVDNIDLDYIKQVSKNPFKKPFYNGIDTENKRINAAYSTYLFSGNCESFEQLENFHAIKNSLFLSQPKAQDLIKGCVSDMSLYTSLELKSLSIDLKCRFEGINIEEGYILIPVITLDASPASVADEAKNTLLHIEAAYKAFLAQRIFKKPFTVYFLFHEIMNPTQSAIYKVSANMRLKGEQELINTLPACYILKHSENNINYSDFCTNESGIFDLDI